VAVDIADDVHRALEQRLDERRHAGTIGHGPGGRKIGTKKSRGRPKAAPAEARTC
jgi:hypothetical protein